MIVYFTRFSTIARDEFFTRSVKSNGRAGRSGAGLVSRVAARLGRPVRPPARKSDARIFEQMARTLFAPARMEARFALFEELCLPPFRLQSDSRFRHVVLVSTLMPRDLLGRLERLQERSAFDILPVSPDTAIEEAVRAWMARLDLDLAPGEPVLTARLDDDDAASRFAVEELHRVAGGLAPGTAIGTANVVELAFSGGGWTAHHLHFPLNSAGMALISGDDGAGRHIFDKPNHLLMSEDADCYLISKPALHILTSHAGNVSARGVRLRRSRADRRPVGVDVLTRDFGLSEPGLDRVAKALRA